VTTLGISRGFGPLGLIFLKIVTYFGRSDMSSQVLELAKQGDTEAISALMNRQLKPQGVSAQVARSQNCLQIMLEGLDVPDQKRMTNFVVQGVQKLGLGSNVQVMGRRMGDKTPAWSESFAISENGVTPIDLQAQAAPHDPVSPAAPVAFGSGDCKQGAKQGNPAALQQFVEEVLSDRPEFTPFVEFADGVVKVTIQTTEFMDGQAFASDFGKLMNELASDQVRELELYKRKSEKTLPFLVNKMTLVSPSAVAATPKFSDEAAELRPSGHSSAMRAPSPGMGPVGQGSKARPSEVTTIASLLFFGAGLGIVAGGVILAGMLALSGAMAEAGAEAGQAAAIGGIGLALAAVPLLLGISQAVVGVGILKMKKWAWVAALVICAIKILITAPSLLKLNILAFFTISLNVSVIRYLILTGDLFD
jgi:hypothetical protein